MSMIVRKIHQLCLSSSMLPLHKILAQTWVRHNPKWQYRLWKEEEVQELLLVYFSNLFSFCQVLPEQHKMHIYKYAILFDEGGVVASIDKECTMPIEEMIDISQSFYISGDYGIMASSKGHPICKGLLSEIGMILNQYGILDEYADNEFGERIIKEKIEEISKLKP